LNSSHILVEGDLLRSKDHVSYLMFCTKLNQICLAWYVFNISTHYNKDLEFEFSINISDLNNLPIHPSLTAGRFRTAYTATKYSKQDLSIQLFLHGPYSKGVMLVLNCLISEGHGVGVGWLPCIDWRPFCFAHAQLQRVSFHLHDE
jgi:hypothetical protein